MKHISTLILFAGLCLGFNSAIAATLTYNGSWSPSAPSSSTGADDVVISSGTAVFSDNWAMNDLTIQSGAAVSFTTSGTVTVNGNLTIENTGALAITGSGSFSVSGTSSMSVTGVNSNNAYNTWSSMFSAAGIESSMGNPNPCDLYTYDALLQEFKYDYSVPYNTTCDGNAVTFTSSNVITDGSADGNFDVGRGYFIPGDASTPTRTFSASGAPNNGTYTYTIYGTSLSRVGGNDWNLLGNPYPSGLSIASFLTTNSSLTGNAVYIYKAADGTYDTENSASADIIAAGQGFFVDPNTTSDGSLGNVQFLNSHRDTDNSTFRSGTYQFAYFSLTMPDSASDKFKVFMDLNASNGFDRVWDARKAPNDFPLHLASYIDTTKYAINGIQPLNVHQSYTMDLFVEVPTAGTYTIALDSVENLPNHSWEIKDNSTGFKHNLVDGPYTISVNGQETYTNRYQLIITNNDATTATSEIIQPNFSVVCAQGMLRVDGLGKNVQEVRIYDLSGRNVVTKNLNTSRTQFSIANLTGGIYMVALSNELGITETMKIVVQ